MFSISVKSFSVFSTGLLCLILSACGSGEESIPANVKPVKLEFLETYSFQELQANWELACLVQERLDSTSVDSSAHMMDKLGTLIDFSNAINMAGVFGEVTKSNKEKVSNILNSPEIKKNFPEDVEFLWAAEPVMSGHYLLYAVKRPHSNKNVITGKDVENVEVEEDESSGQLILSLTMTNDGADKWFQLTERNVERALAITIDGKVMSAPLVNSPIAGGKVWISGNFTVQEAENLAMGIRAGKR